MYIIPPLLQHPSIMVSVKARFLSLDYGRIYEDRFSKADGGLVTPSSLMSLGVSCLNFQVLYFKHNLLLFTFQPFFLAHLFFMYRIVVKRMNGISLGYIAGGMINIESCSKHVVSIFRNHIL